MHSVRGGCDELPVRRVIEGLCVCMIFVTWVWVRG